MRHLLEHFIAHGMGRAFARFSGWRAACFVANPNFVEAFAHAPIMPNHEYGVSEFGVWIAVSAGVYTRGMFTIWFQDALNSGFSRSTK